MNRNTESRFAMQPSISIGRSTFDRSSSIKTTFNAGELIPFYLEEVLPGDTFNVRTSKVVRMPSLVTPAMDNIYLDTYYFFVPNRLIWDHWKEFCGENTESAWIPPTEYTIPQVTAPTATGWTIGSIADYFGIPVGVDGFSVSALPFRAYALICNEWFRNQNLSDPLVVPTDDATQVGSNSGGLDDIACGGLPYKAAKYHDYFTSCLPSPQKGPDVSISVLSTDTLPVYGTGKSLALTNGDDLFGLAGVNSISWGILAGQDYSTSTPDVDNMSGVVGVPTREKLIDDEMLNPQDSGLLAYVGDGFNSVTVNDLRLAFQIQKFYEKQARSGSRYTEVVRSFFGVISPDARLQRPEYLGGNRIPININQVIQQSGTQETGTPQGTVVGMSQTTDTHGDFVKSFTEHGYIIGLMVARYDHTYQQGLARMWSRKDKFDFYWPVFANIGEQAVLNKEIYVAGTVMDDRVFGYQEAWADYRYKPNIVTGDMRSKSDRSLDVWHLADDYRSTPSLSDSWIREESSNIDRILAVSSDVSHQFFADIYIQNRCTRPMPLYSIPGLIDHH